jgi:hypothetical protein
VDGDVVQHCVFFGHLYILLLLALSPFPPYLNLTQTSVVDILELHLFGMT